MHYDMKDMSLTGGQYMFKIPRTFHSRIADKPI